MQDNLLTRLNGTSSDHVIDFARAITTYDTLRSFEPVDLSYFRPHNKSLVRILIRHWGAIDSCLQSFVGRLKGFSFDIIQ